MDFFDPEKQKAHGVRLIIGYVLIGLMILLATILLVFMSRGFSIDRHGKVIQNGLVIISSVPDGAEVYVNDKKEANTGARLVLPAGQYVFELRRAGYQTWKRAIAVEGGTVQRFDYPFLFPTSPDSVMVRSYEVAPSFASQSIDRRWVLVQAPVVNTFELFNLERPNDLPQQLAVPVEVISANTTTTGWEEVEWAKDNRHVLLKRHFDRLGQPGYEYILLDREQLAQSRNLSVVLGFTPTVLALRDQAYDQYYAYNQPNASLLTATLERPTPQPLLDHVLAFEAVGQDRILYATTQDAPPGRTNIRMLEGGQAYTIRQVASDAAPYLLAFAEYEGAWYVAAGASAEDKVYLYRNPVDQLKGDANAVLVPSYILKLDNPVTVSFAPDNRYIALQRDRALSVYDVRNTNAYAYEIGQPGDTVQGAATWMNDSHLTLVVNGTVVAFDYDGVYQQSLAAQTGLRPYFAPDYRRMYTLNPSGAFSATELRTAQDR